MGPGMAALRIAEPPLVDGRIFDLVTKKKNNYIKSQNIEKIIYSTLEKAYKRAKEIDSEKKNTKSQ